MSEPPPSPAIENLYLLLAVKALIRRYGSKVSLQTVEARLTQHAETACRMNRELAARAELMTPDDAPEDDS